ncbi:Autophagy-related protein 9A [Nymphon striatum]|nr:Autophagy-related protein 9A [Nymphon striatum]
MLVRNVKRVKLLATIDHSITLLPSRDMANQSCSAQGQDFVKMPNLQTGYQPLYDDPDTPHDDVMIHVVPQNKPRWNHIEDLDSFFIRTYIFHQRNGYNCILLEDILELLKIAFVIFMATFLTYGIDYQMLFKERPGDLSKKIELQDTFIPVSKWNSGEWQSDGNLHNLAEVGNELLNLKWHDVLLKLIETQKEQQMCIHKAELTELGNYFFTEGLKFNLEFLVFWGPWALFQNNWHLNEEYKRQGARKELADRLSKRILWLGIANAVLAIFIFPWQVLYTFFTHCQVLRYDPSKLSMRKWTAYGRLYLRHYNELDHELNQRLCRAYRPAKIYMNSFTSPVLTVAAHNLIFICGAILGVCTICTIIDEDFISIGHVVQVMTVSFFLWKIGKACIPDENAVRCHEDLLTIVLSEIHYMPDHWKGNAHKTVVRDEFCKLFQYTFVNIFEELMSPIITPFFLIFVLRHKALDIVDFFRNFTVDVVGVGDVCSFAQLDIRNHGNPQWSIENKSDVSQYEQGENGKTELSLMHFTFTNPNWKPPQESSSYIDTHLPQTHGLHLNSEGYNPFPTIHEMSSHSSLVSRLNNDHLIYRNAQLPRHDLDIVQKPFEVEINTSEPNTCLPTEEVRAHQGRTQLPQNLTTNVLGVRNPSIYSSIGMYSSTQDIFPSMSNMPSWNSPSTSSQAMTQNSSIVEGNMRHSDETSLKMSESVLFLHKSSTSSKFTLIICLSSLLSPNGTSSLDPTLLLHILKFQNFIYSVRQHPGFYHVTCIGTVCLGAKELSCYGFDRVECERTCD